MKISLSKMAGYALIGLLLLLWEASARWGGISSSNWPRFSDVVGALWQGLRTGELIEPWLATMLRMALGYVIGCSIAVAAALLMEASWAFQKASRVPLELLRPIPLTALIPPLVLFLGIEDKLKVFVVAFACFFPVLLSTRAGIQSVSDTLKQTAETFRLSKRKANISMIFPAALPAIFAGLRTALGIALVIVVTAEMIAGSSGLGYFIVENQYAMAPAPMYAAVICLAFTGYALNRLFVSIERIAIPWYEK